MNDPTSTHRLLPIGELSRASGLTVSALRFYDREGLLVPADVDGHTGYRRYSPGQVRLARLLAGMRRVGMPLSEMAAVLAALPDAEAADDLLTAHLRRLEDGLLDARREVERLQTLLPGVPAHTWTAEVEVGELVQALDGVRYAVGTDPDFPMLRGVLFEPGGESLQLVATDRYRLAMMQAPATISGPRPEDAQTGRAALLPTSVIDQLRRWLGEAEDRELVRLRLSRTRVVLEISGEDVVSGDCLDLDFPDYRRLLHGTGQSDQSVRLPVADILAALSDQAASAEPSDRVVLHAGGIGDGAGVDAGAGPLVDRTFLWEAASAATDGHAVLPLGDQIAPLTFHGADDVVVSLLMPVRPDPTS